MVLCSIDFDRAWGFWGRSSCRLQPGRSAGLLDLRNKKPMARGSDDLRSVVDHRFWCVGALPNENPNRSPLRIWRILDSGIRSRLRNHNR